MYNFSCEHCGGMVKERLVEREVRFRWLVIEDRAGTEAESGVN